MAPVLSILATGLMAINGALAHPGHSVQQEAAERGQWLRARQPNSVRSCAGDLQRRGHLEAALTRRQEMAKNARVKRSLPSKRFERRDFAEYNISHASDLDVTLGSDELLLFSDNSSCVLQPEVTQGPYFVDGELIRQDVTEDQAGVPLYLDIQLIDTSTCEPVPAVFIDIWHCNATGVYSGVSAAGNGNEDDVSNIQNTFLRGIQQTDANGVAQFETIVPGHYTSRAPHIHVLSHNTNDTIVRTNGTLLEGYGNFSVHASHVGQLFMDQDLLARVSETAPYNTNTQELTLNSDDQILSAETETMDPFIQYVLVGDDIEDGIMAWISLGIDPTADTEVTSVGTHYEDGGVVNTESSMGGGGDAPGGNSTGGAPSGSMPSGSAPTAAASSASAY